MNNTTTQYFRQFRTDADFFVYKRIYQQKNHSFNTFYKLFQRFLIYLKFHMEHMLRRDFYNVIFYEFNLGCYTAKLSATSKIYGQGKHHRMYSTMASKIFHIQQKMICSKRHKE